MTETNRIEFKRELTRELDLERDVEMVESLGSGMNRIMRTYGRDNFEFGGNYVRMIVPYNWIPQNEDGPVNGQKVADDSMNVGNDVGSLSEVQLTERQKKICEYMRVNPLISAKEMSEVLSVVQRTIERDIAFLQKNGIVKHHGNTSGGHWEVIDNK